MISTLTFNCNITLRFAKFATRLCFSSQASAVTLKICGILARLEAASLCVLVLVSPHCFLRHSIIGGMATKEKRLYSSRSGRSPVQSSLDTTSRSGRTDIHSSQKSRVPPCHRRDQGVLSSRPTTHFRSVSEETQHCWQLSGEGSRKSTSENILLRTSSRPSSPQTDSPTTSDDEWWLWNGGEFE